MTYMDLFDTFMILPYAWSKLMCGDMIMDIRLWTIGLIKTITLINTKYKD